MKLNVLVYELRANQSVMRDNKRLRRTSWCLVRPGRRHSHVK